MSDPSPPPFTQTPFAPPPPPQATQLPAKLPAIQYDANGIPWLCDPNGNWVVASTFQLPKQGLAPPASSTIAQSAAQAPSFNFPSTSSGPPHASGSNKAYPALIDPRLLPQLPDDDDLDLTHPYTIAKACLGNPAPKVGGSRRKSKDPKGKKRRYSSDSDNGASDGERAPKRGRRKGSSNFSREDVMKLLDCVEKHLPLGQKGWKAVQSDFGKWASGSGRPERDVKSLETKYKLLLKTKKPTGDAHCPPEIKRAHHIEGLINHRADTRELSDSEFDEGSDSSIEVLDPPAAVRTAVARRAASPPLRRKSRMNAPELVDKLSRAFDPAALQSRNDERAQQSFQTTQIFTLSQQLRDAQATIEALRTQITTMQNHINDVERARERAEMRLEMRRGGYAGPSKPLWRSQFKGRSDVERNDGKVRCEQVYPDGGACTYWISDPSTDGDDESDKENRDPSSSSSRMHLRASSPLPVPNNAVAGPSTVDAGSATGDKASPSI
ncbi:hypothetical protein MVEN_00014800 [Mycena venus]|uniref:DUF6818 domain-containing protein n=1 Tax=Mycena venus TaxID=2733690 RepID=A0A8H6Z5Z3_9AGAR|nr:hypothetical protein MVEN_00014800 [Mycena venus]